MAFVPDPGGLDPKTVKYVAVDAAVLLADCSHCGMKAGEMCRGSSGRPGLSTHWCRRYAARREKKRLRAGSMLATAWRVIFK